MPVRRSAFVASRGWLPFFEIILLVLFFGPFLTGTAFAQDEGGSWEMRVCAQPHDPPMSSRIEPGVDNRIAEILADELNAYLSYEWTQFDSIAIRRTLLAGECDLAIGVAEDAGGVLSTVPYLRTPYVFVWRTDDPVQVESLDSESLRDRAIGTYQSGIPSIALSNRGIDENVIEYAPVASPGGPDRDRAILDALLEGEIDVAIVYGPAAAHRARQHPGELEFAPVQPEVDAGASLLQFFRIWTIGVRPNDHALRDRLNAALAERWDEVQAAIDEYGVPRLQIVRPVATPRDSEDPTTRVGVGVIAPTASGAPVALEPLGEPARFGALVAENAVARHPDSADLSFQVLQASAPTPEAAVRAAERLVATEEVDAIVGGFGADRAERLVAVAEDRDIIFFNVGAIDDSLRNELCRPNIFHVQASASMYIDAIVTWFARQDRERWFIVHQEDDEGETLYERTLRALEEQGDTVADVGRAAVPADQFLFLDAIEEASEAGADIVLLLLPPQAQEMFLSQFATSGSAAAVTGLPYPLAQTREFLYRFHDVAPDAGETTRIALWEASAAEGAMGELNETYLSRSALPMEGTAWATYASIMIMFEAAAADAAGDPASTIAFLSDSDRTFEVGKAPVSFRPWNHQLRQPLYAVEVDPEATWARSGPSRVPLAHVVGRLPEAATDPVTNEALDRFGMGPDASSCVF